MDKRGLESGPDKQKKRALRNKGRFIAIGAIFVVACSFSYCAGMQQQVINNKLPVNKAMSSNEEINQNEIEAGSANNVTEQDIAENNRCEEENNGGFDYRMRHRGMRRFSHRDHNFNDETDQQNDPSYMREYDATPQSCCATGKTGTCHS